MKKMDDELKARAKKLRLWGLLAHWDEIGETGWIETLIRFEEEERNRRSLEERIRKSRVGRFKDIADFDWTWPKKVDRMAIDELFQLSFIDEFANVIFVGQNGSGKTMIAQNIAYHAVKRGYTALFTTAGNLLQDLNAQETTRSLMRKLKTYERLDLLVVDEVGYLSYDDRHADLFFEIVNRRYQKKSTVITTNKPFTEWNDIFPSASCVVTLIDRLIHHSEIIKIDADSYRLKEAKERAINKKKKNVTPKKPE